LPLAPRPTRRGDVLHRVGWPVRLGGAGGLGRARGCSAAARRHAAALQRARNTARGRARLDAPGRGRLLPVGEAGVRPVLGLLERLAVVDLFAARHGHLSGASDPVSRLLPAGLGWLERWIVALAMIWGATWLNLWGTRVVGAASGWFVAAVLAPFAVLSVAALVRWLGASATPFPVTPFHAAGTSFLGALGIGVS